MNKEEPRERIVSFSWDSIVSGFAVNIYEMCRKKGLSGFAARVGGVLLKPYSQWPSSDRVFSWLCFNRNARAVVVFAAGHKANGPRNATCAPRGLHQRYVERLRDMLVCACVSVGVCKCVCTCRITEK